MTSMELNKNRLLAPAELAVNRALDVGCEVVSRIQYTYGLGRVAMQAVAEYSAFETSDGSTPDENLAPIIPIGIKSRSRELSSSHSLDAS